ncbi:Metallo-dependent phosphatase [Neoconidiobolus thromboides FSU 785]|nr:Metallo-dependent phosphatase [Neoconidiobolus thromboides FSU 785]
MNLIILIFVILFHSNYKIGCHSHKQRIIVVGDLHGDYNHLIKILRMTKVINHHYQWIGGNYTTLIQTGDVTDRGPDAKKLYNYFINLRSEAKTKGGLFIPLLGNHEIMNLAENYKYVSEKDISNFGSLNERKKALSKDGVIGQYLRNLTIAIKVRDTVFCHGGINLNWSTKKVDDLNKKARHHLLLDNPKQLRKRAIFTQKGDGPLWYRGYSKESEDEMCPKLTEVLNRLEAKRMVIGHTIQKKNRITARCNNRIILIDVGISSYFRGGHLAALEITDEFTRAIYPNGQFEYFGQLKILDYHQRQSFRLGSSLFSKNLNSKKT